MEINPAKEYNRLQPIHASSKYMGKFRSEISIRDLPPYYVDEPKFVGGDDMGPTPLETILGALCGCTSMIIYILKNEMKFEFEDMRCEADGVTDKRGLEMRKTGKKYSEIEPITFHFASVKMKIHIKTDESDERFETMKELVAKLCPVSKLLEHADVPFEVTWIRK
jgi:uncharacterized OsmC-like protein